MRRAYLLIFSFLLVLTAFAHPASARRVALVIGNSAYEHATPLANPKNDAQAVSAVLKKLGFEVITGLDLTQAQLGETIRSFARAIRGAKTALFFYAGHGLQVQGNNYLAPIDAKLGDEADLEFETVRLETVLRQMEREPRTNLVFLDACRDNPLARNLARTMGTRSANVGRGLARIESGIGTLIAFATQPGNVALDGSGHNSPFTTALLRHIETPNLDVALLMRRVREEVIANTNSRQVPWSNSSLTGTFAFLEGGSGQPAPAPKRQTPVATPGNAAAQAWDAVKSSDSEAVLEAFIKQFPGGVYGALASERLKRLKAKKVAAAKRTSVAPGDYSKRGSYACFGKAVFPSGWRKEAYCVHFGCNFGVLNRQDCLALGAKKGSKTVIHGKTGGGRSNECWLQHSCGDLRRHGDFSLFRR